MQIWEATYFQIKHNDQITLKKKNNTAQIMSFSIKDFFSKCKEI